MLELSLMRMPPALDMPPLPKEIPLPPLKMLKPT
jgi:hypothetical protein